MEFYETINKRRSIRQFEDKPVPREVLERILDAGLKAPSSNHQRRWELVALTDKHIILDVAKFVKESDLVVKIIDRHIEERGIDIKNAPVIVAGGYGMGSKENFAMLHELADLLGGEVGASRAAVDAGFTDHARQVGQTGVTVRPKLYIACGISGQIQHTAGMDQASIVIAINTDPEAPINKFADYVITGSALEVVPKMIKFYKQNSK